MARKLELRLQDTKTYNYKEYLAYLRSNPEELDDLVKTLTIKASNFFRNPLVYELLNSFILPELISEFRSLNIWSLGCAKGEEPYSVAMIIHELLKRENKPFDVKIVGTDMCDGAIETAVTGEYPDNELSEVKKRHMDAFFQRISTSQELPFKQKHIFRLIDEIRSMVRFECGDIISRLKSREARLNACNLILCRNVLIYMNRGLQEEVLKNISDILCENGYLVIGESETIPETYNNTFSRVFPGVKIYRKRAKSDPSG